MHGFLEQEQFAQVLREVDGGIVVGQAESAVEVRTGLVRGKQRNRSFPGAGALPRLGSVRGVAEHQRDVDVARPEHAERLGRFGLGQPQVNARLVFAQQRRGGRHDGAERRRERRQPQPSGPQAGIGRQFVLRGIEPADHLGAPLGQEPAGVGQPDAPACPLDQLGPGFGFQPRQVVAHGGLRVVQGSRRGRDRTVPGHSDQDAQPRHVEHAPTIDPVDQLAQRPKPGLLRLISPGQHDARRRCAGYRPSSSGESGHRTGEPASCRRRQAMPDRASSTTRLPRNAVTSAWS